MTQLERAVGARADVCADLRMTEVGRGAFLGGCDPPHALIVCALRPVVDPRTRLGRRP